LARLGVTGVRSCQTQKDGAELLELSRRTGRPAS
jgi:hypothetical protein